MTGPVLAVDQGTSGTKALVICPERGVIGSGSAPVRPRYGPGERSRRTPANCSDRSSTPGRRPWPRPHEPVAAVGLANQGETVLAWDPDTGKPLTDAIVWQDRRAEQLCQELAPHEEELKHLTGLPLDPYFAAPKMAWIRRELTGKGVVTTSDSWLVHRLTGAFVTDAATASTAPSCSTSTTSAGRPQPWTYSVWALNACRPWSTRQGRSARRPRSAARSR